MTNTPHHPSPRLFFETASAYQRSAALHTAVELGLFTAIGNCSIIPEIAKACNCSERGVRILCDFLTILGFLTKQDANYYLTEDSAVFLNRNSPTYLGDTLHFLHSDTVTHAFQSLTTAVSQGGTALPGKGTMDEAHPVWGEFARSLGVIARHAALQMTHHLSFAPKSKLRTLDIAAGHGFYGITLAQQHPNMEVVAQDWPHVLTVAVENARQMGVGERYTTLPGSAFEVDFGTGYDVVLVTNFLHHFDVATCETLLKKVYAALADGGQAVTVDFVPHEDRISPPDSAAFSLTMLATTPAGDAYTFAEYETMFRNAGFTHSEIHPLHQSANQVILSRK